MNFKALELEEDDVVLVQEMLCDNKDTDKEYHEKTGPQTINHQVWDVADEDIDSDFSSFHKHYPSLNVNPLQGLHERVNCIIRWILLFLCLWSSLCVILDNALEILLEEQFFSPWQQLSLALEALLLHFQSHFIC